MDINFIFELVVRTGNFPQDFDDYDSTVLVCKRWHFILRTYHKWRPKTRLELGPVLQESGRFIGHMRHGWTISTISNSDVAHLNWSYHHRNLYVKTVAFHSVKTGLRVKVTSVRNGGLQWDRSLSKAETFDKATNTLIG